MFTYLSIAPLVYSSFLGNILSDISNQPRDILKKIKNTKARTFLMNEFENKDAYSNDDDNFEKGLIPDTDWLPAVFWDKVKVIDTNTANQTNFNTLLSLLRLNRINYNGFHDYIFSLGAGRKLDQAIPRFAIERSKTHPVMVILFNPVGGCGKLNETDIHQYINTICHHTEIPLHLTIIDTSFSFLPHPLPTQFFDSIKWYKRIFILDFISREYNIDIFTALKSTYGQYKKIIYINGILNFIKSISTNNRDLIDVYTLQGVSLLNFTGPCYNKDEQLDTCPINTLTYHAFTNNTIMRNKIKSIVKNVYPKKRSARSRHQHSMRRK